MRFLPLFLILISSCLFSAAAFAQNRHIPGVPLDEFISKSDKSKLDEQARNLYEKFDKITAPFGDSVVYVCRNNRVVALGTVIAPGKILTKWKDLSNARGALVVVHKKELYETRILGGDEDHDLVLLECPSLKAPALNFSNKGKTEEGDFLLTVLPTGEAGDFGVISVPARSLRENDLPYLGIFVDMRFNGEGTLVDGVDPRSAAVKAGVQKGDLLLKLDGKTLSGPFAIRSALKDKKPGDSVLATLKRGDKTFDSNIQLSNRPQAQQFPEQRLEQMNAVGNPMNARRKDFPLVIQTDMTMDPSHAGAPVVDVEGKVVGLALSRAGRTETYILPATLIEQSIKSGLTVPAEVVQTDKTPTRSPGQEEHDKNTQKLSEDLRNMQHNIQKAEEVEEVESSPLD